MVGGDRNLFACAASLWSHARRPGGTCYCPVLPQRAPIDGRGSPQGADHKRGLGAGCRASGLYGPTSGASPMIRNCLLPLAIVAPLAACSPQAQDQIAQNAARSALTPVVTDRFPGVPLQPALDCLIDNANAQQIRALAADAVLGPTENTVQIATDIASKPETLRCLAASGLPALLR
jgi:hypothetical protein